MFKISGRREMFVFDTPLARLDSETRTLFIRNIVANISDQVLILSTDSEFVGDNYDLISKNIARTYLLNYNDATKATTIELRYF
jgi:DNA sulfur modification protein DndD